MEKRTTPSGRNARRSHPRHGPRLARQPPPLRTTAAGTRNPANPKRAGAVSGQLPNVAKYRECRSTPALRNYAKLNPLGRKYRREDEDCQDHPRIRIPHVRPGWTREIALELENEATIGYGSVAQAGPWRETPALYEFFSRARASPCGPSKRITLLLECCGATIIETQSNDGMLAAMLHVVFGRKRAGRSDSVRGCVSTVASPPLALVFERRSRRTPIRLRDPEARMRARPGRYSEWRNCRRGRSPLSPQSGRMVTFIWRLRRPFRRHGLGCVSGAGTEVGVQKRVEVCRAARLRNVDNLASSCRF